MQSVLMQLELVNKDRDGLKERLFEWIADLSQREFDQLCNEIISLDSFFKKYDGATVTDRAELVRTPANKAPKVEFVVDTGKGLYNRAFFYRWLENIPVPALQAICWELEDCCDQVRELLNTYIVARVYPSLVKANVYWKINTAYIAGNLPLMANVVKTWSTKVVRRSAVPV